MREALEGQGCRIIYASEPTRAPFVLTFEMRTGERMGVIAYAFLATRTKTRNRPDDERSFQIKYGSKHHNQPHQIWQDPLGLFTTILVGISPERGYFVAVDPEMHRSSTRTGTQKKSSGLVGSHGSGAGSVVLIILSRFWSGAQPSIFLT
jgi:hypothetical protein